VSDRDEYERELLDAMRAYLAPDRALPDRRTSGAVTTDEVRLDGSYPATELVVVLRDSARPDCRFGLRARIWTDDGRPRGELHQFASPAEFAMILNTHLEEEVMAYPGLPDECEPGAVTWIGIDPLWL
jgi:hypothetical protein